MMYHHCPAGALGFHSGNGQADSGWGCGYRNIQMQISHQLMRGDAAVRHALFGGCGYVPDIGELLATSSCWLQVRSCTSVGWLASLSMHLPRIILLHGGLLVSILEVPPYMYSALLSVDTLFSTT
jgi:hypothetical protein